MDSVRVLAAGLVSLALLISSPIPASAACGDSVLNAGEECDDGNTQAGDCCSAGCAFEQIGTACEHGLPGLCWSAATAVCDGSGSCRPAPPGCLVAGKSRTLSLHDPGGVERDSLSWRLRYGRYHCFDQTPAGDPTTDTSYAFCIWTYEFSQPNGGYAFLNDLVYEKVIPPGIGWEPTRDGWRYRERSAGGSTLVRARNLAQFSVRGDAAGLPGPVEPAQYFDRVLWGLVNSAGYCHVAGGSRVSANTLTRFKTHQSGSCD